MRQGREVFLQWINSTPRIGRAMVLGLLTALLGLVVTATGLGTSWEQDVGLDWLFTLRGPTVAPTDVVMVTMDATVATKFSDSAKLRDWRRAHHAQLVDELTKRKAAVIAFDLTFEQPRPDDPVFAAALRRSKRVVLYQWAAQAGSGELVGDKLISPTKSLVEAASGLGPFPLPEPSSGRTDRFWTFFDRVGDAPTIPVVALQLRVLQQVGYKTFQWLLQAADVAIRLPNNLASAAELRTTMGALRGAFRSASTHQRFLQVVAAHAGMPDASKQLLRALADVYHGPSHRFFGFYGPPLTIAHLRYEDFWDPGQELPDLTDKVVFVGATERSERDDFFTVYARDDGQKHNGIEVLATGFANLLHGHSLRFPSGLSHLSILFGFGLVVGLISLLLRGLLGVVAVLVLGGMYLAVVQLMFNLSHVWLPLFVPLVVQLPFAMLAGALSSNRWLERAATNLKRLLGYHLPSWVVENSEDNAGPVPPQRVYGTCLVSDVAGFTTLAEQVPPEQLVNLSNTYFDCLIERIKHHEGEMMGIVGDGMTGIWPAQQPDRLIRLRGCLAALDMLRAIDQFNAEHPQTPFPTRIGLHAGWVVMGDLGGSGRFSFGLTGDIVNTASRLEGLSKYLGTRLLATDTVVKGLDELLFRRVGRFQLKGKGEALSVHEVLAHAQDATSDMRLLSARFESALASFEAGHWRDAAQQFSAVSASFPGDGPSAFYLERCRHSAMSPPPKDGDVLIQLDVK